MSNYMPDWEIERLRGELRSALSLLKRTGEALVEYRHAMEGFAEAVRIDTNKPYPWPAQAIAMEKVDPLLADLRRAGVLEGEPDA